jgi:HEAT repeat protein
MTRSSERRVLLAALTLLVCACEGAERSYNGRSAASWATQLSAPTSGDRVAAADALYHIAPQSKEVVDALLRAMRDTSAEVQSAVAVTLAIVGPRTLSGLAEAISDDHASVRALALNLLSGQGAAADFALPRITLALHDPDEAVRREAAATLERLGPLARSAAPALAAGARSGTPEFRAACLLALAAIPADSGVVLPVAIASLHDAAAVMRRAAIRAIAGLATDAKRQFTLILPLMRDQDTSVRLEAYRAMGGLTRDREVGPTAHAALGLARSDPDASARALVQRLLSPQRRSDPEAEFHARPRGVVVREPE